MGLFGKAPERNPRDQVKEWTSKLRKQQYVLDRNVRNIEREEAKVKLSLKQAAKKGDKDVCRILAKEVVQSRKAVNRINASKAQLNSVSLHMTQQGANLKVAGALAKSTDVMKAMSNLVKLPQISETMRELSKEMTKAGIMEEMMEDTMEDMFDEEDMEEEISAEVDKVLFELTAGVLGTAPAAVSDTIGPSTSKAPASKVQDEEEEDNDIEEMKKRLDALKS